jgi:hypothetical protein
LAYYGAPIAANKVVSVCPVAGAPIFSVSVFIAAVTYHIPVAVVGCV